MITDDDSIIPEPPKSPSVKAPSTSPLDSKALKLYSCTLSKDMKVIKSKLKLKTKTDKFTIQMSAIVDKLMEFDRSELPLRTVILFLLESTEHYFTKRKSGELKLKVCKDILIKHINDDNLVDELIHSLFPQIRKSTIVTRHLNFFWSLVKRFI